MPATDLECLSQAIYFEARSESEAGQTAVAEVVLNRAKSGRYPGQICEVVYQRNHRTCQFTFTCDGSIGRGVVNAAAWARATRIAHSVLSGAASRQLPDSALNYHANYVSPSWGRRLQRVRQIGAHIFYGPSVDGSPTPGALDAPVTQTAQTGGLIIARNEALDAAYAALGGGR